jgi:hypothetical protein
VYFLKTREEVDSTTEPSATAALEATVMELQQNQRQMMKLLREQQEKTKEQQEINSLLREYFASTNKNSI